MIEKGGEEIRSIRREGGVFVFRSEKKDFFFPRDKSKKVPSVRPKVPAPPKRDRSCAFGLGKRARYR